MAPLRIALAQIDLVLGDIAGNRAPRRRQASTCSGMRAQLVAFPEMAVTGDPPGVKVMPPAFGRDWRVPITNAFSRDS